MVELGYEDTLLMTGKTVTVRATEDWDHPHFTSEKGVLGDYEGGQQWDVEMTTGKRAGKNFLLPSLSLQGHEGTVP